MTSKFTVDTHLFRELGELLVGRDSTALVELVKNAYDADATEVVVHGENLERARSGRIVVADNGIGMTLPQFELGFLRVASRLKEEGDRRSLRFKRRFTGAKGIGRLAAHKLAHKIEIQSVPWTDDGHERRMALEASIDWDKIEGCTTLDDIEHTDAISVVSTSVGRNARSGTTLALLKLRRVWTATERARFFAEIQSFDPPEFLRRQLPRSVLETPLLFAEPLIRDTSAVSEGKKFRVRLEGEFAGGEEYWGLVAEVATWVLEIRARQKDNKVHFAIAPTKRTKRDNPAAQTYRIAVPHPTPTGGPFFDARIMVREGPLKAKRDQRVWASRSSGVRVYMEGFRVLPYGEDDWLSIDADYTRRSRQLEMLGEWEDQLRSAGEKDPDEGLIRLPNNNYFGAVFLTLDKASTLRVLINREGFVPDIGFDTLVQLVRTGIDLCTRVRASAAYAARQERKQERSAARHKASKGTDSVTAEAERGSLHQRLGDVVVLLQSVRKKLGAGDVDVAKRGIPEAEALIRQIAQDAISEQALLRVVASVGTQMAAFVHEINSLLGTSQTIEHALGRLLKDVEFSRDQRRRIEQVILATQDLRRGLERHASYLMDVVTPDARRKRARQRLADRFEAAVRLVAHQAERREIEIVNGIPADLKSPPMFPAELTTVFANLLTNAVKAAGKGGKILASGLRTDDAVNIVIQNTGVVVDLSEAERWFRPFESTTLEVNPVLGQGMGLGLPITRSVIESYGGEVRFIRAKRPFATSIEISFPS